MNYDFSGILILSAMLILLFGFALISLYKIKKIHLATYVIQSDAAATRREAEALFAQIQAMLALERKLGLAEALPPMRGWAGSPDFLLAVADETLEVKPACVMECSSGISTLVIARCLQMNGTGHVYSLEHDPEYAGKTRKLLNRHGLSDWATVLDAPLKKKDRNTPWYSEAAIPENMAPIEMLIIDGPPASTAPLARFPALPILMPRMAGHPVILIDDADRKDEVEIIRRWMALYPQFKKRNLDCEKGLILLYA